MAGDRAGPASWASGQRVRLRKPHACGANAWIVLQAGADVRLRCERCRRRIFVPRDEFERAARPLPTAETVP